ncbi:MAG: LysM peptidoglycan-binding domain-containing protein [Anaerolineales bacterium]|nr:LysM peptidoglycan-binding domain-containing protein [Anaerolineales bacterium]
MIAVVLLASLLAGCSAAPAAVVPTPATEETYIDPDATAIPTRGLFPPGEVFDYTAQNGDTLEALAAHFNTTVAEIRAENPGLPEAVTTLPAGYPMRIPAYYVPLTGPAFKILPDSEVVNGPTAIGVDIEAEIRSHPGYLAGMESYANDKQRTSWNVVEVISNYYSINPRLLLALLEHQSGALSIAEVSDEILRYPLGVDDYRWRGLYLQLSWAAERLNDGYYGWRTGTMKEIVLADGLVLRPDPWQNAGTVALQSLFAGMYGKAEFEQAVSPGGFYKTYYELWGDPFENEQVLIPGSLQQPELSLPFPPNRVWDFTGGPHPSWGTSLPLGALDFAPPSEETGCVPSDEWFTAPEDGVIARSEEATVVLDLDGDGDARTGWVLFFFHVATQGRVPAGRSVARGDLLGHPSCEGGRATGTHIHVARLYNGEWIPAGGTIPFVLDGWMTAYGDAPYEGTLTKGSKIVPASPSSRAENQIIYTLPE